MINYPKNCIIKWILSQDWIWESLKEKVRPVVESRPKEPIYIPDDDYWDCVDEY